MEGTLSGTRILEVATMYFVPAAGALLADWGAQVTKIEHPVTGDTMRGVIHSGSVPTETGGINYMWEVTNRGKRSVGLNLRHPDGLQILYRLATDADVFLTNYLAESRRLLKIDVEHIRAQNPNIIYVRGTGQGIRGPEADSPGFDMSSYWARSGLAHAHTLAGEPPVLQRPAMGDAISGLGLAGGIAAALFRRERTGQPSIVDASLLATGLWSLAPDIMAAALYPGVDRPRFGRDDQPNPGVGMYRTKDGRYISLYAFTETWEQLCGYIGREDLADDPRFKDPAARFENRRECIRIIRDTFEAATVDEWRQRLSAVPTSWAVVQTPSEALRDPQVVANGYLPQVRTGDGTDRTFTIVGSPIQFDEAPTAPEPAPEHGQHTEDVLLEVGYDWDDITRFKESGAIM